ncbi:MAG: M13 family metallopeptidase [Bacteroidota bacterium]
MEKRSVVVIGMSALLSLAMYTGQAQKMPISDIKKAIDLNNLDTSVQPCENFFLYANGGWLKKTPIPASESRWGSFNELADQNNATLRSLLEEEATRRETVKGSNSQKVGDFYASGMDSLAIEKAGIASAKAELDRIALIRDVKTLLETNAHNHMQGVGAMYNLYVAQDDKKSDEYALNLVQGGLGLPDRDYYLKDDARSQNIRQEYMKHLQNVFQLLGSDEAKAKQQSESIVAIETQLAKASMTRVQLRDPYASYNKKTLEEAGQLTPQINWPSLFSQMGIPPLKTVIIGQPEFFKSLNQLLGSVALEDWKTYLRWHVVRQSAFALPHAFVKENFRFYSGVLSGTKEMQPRWKRVARVTDASLGEALGQLYVAKVFPPEAKQRLLTMIKNIQAAFREHVQNVDWMSDVTKQQALKKLDSFVSKIGYPDKWRDYKALTIDRKSYLANVWRSNEFAFKYDANKLGKPIDRLEWGMSPPTVNAYYNPSMNEIVFPAGILRPPFFNPSADDAVNYGSIGAVIGHELTHGFDDQGRQYDAQGNLKDWWTPADGENFNKRAEVVEKQFSAYQPLDSVYVNGKLTLGENLADLGGLSISYTALQKALAGKKSEKIDGFTPEQRFFLAYAQVWRMNARPEFLRRQVLTDPHSPAEYRVNGPLSNMPVFFKAFGCKDGDKMVRPEKDRAKVW